MTRPGSTQRGSLLGWAALLIAVVTAIVWIVVALSSGDETISVHGWIALALGIVGTAMVAGVLMWLLFKSSRGGHDR
ncbi:MAG TPA: hypothetical protein VF342_13235 [Alphaproteobacteria bacterium]